MPRDVPPPERVAPRIPVTQPIPPDPPNRAAGIGPPEGRVRGDSPPVPTTFTYGPPDEGRSQWPVPVVEPGFWYGPPDERWWWGPQIISWIVDYGPDFSPPRPDHPEDPGWDSWYGVDPGGTDDPGFYFDFSMPAADQPPDYATHDERAVEFQKKQGFRKDLLADSQGGIGHLARRIRRSQTRRNWRLKKPLWQDPYPWIPGTGPEKHLFEALTLMGIYFVFQGQIREFEEGDYITLSVPGYEPDFVLPEYRVILDPWSPFHHSIASHTQTDVQKIALYEAMGYRYIYVWALAPGVWAFDQVGFQHGRMTTREVLASIPELSRSPIPITYARDLPFVHQGYRIGQNLGAGATSVAAANRARARPKDRFIGRR